MASDYEAKKAARIDRYRGYSANAKKRSDQKYAAASKIVEMIPFGQPILVGHHSEGRHRSHLKKIQANMRASIAENDKANHWEHRAEAAENSTAISSDDPRANEKLEARIAELEAKSNMMITVNRIVRSAEKKSKDEAAVVAETMAALQVDESTAREHLAPYLTERVGIYGRNKKVYQPWELQNNNQNLCRLKKRLEEIKAKAAMQDRFELVGEVAIVQNMDENRLQIYFPGKPDEATRRVLKRSGFRFAPSTVYRKDGKAYRKAWQRNLHAFAFDEWVANIRKAEIKYE